jgi:hypothetical protein
MSKLNAKSFLSKVYNLSCSKLKLKRREKIIFFRLLGFLIRNDKPFPYSTDSMAQNTGYDRRSIFRALNELERLRLIERLGFTNQVKFKKGRILIRICSLVTKSINIELNKSSTLVTPCHKLPPTSDTMSYKRTYTIEHKDMRAREHNPDYQEYVTRIKGDIELGLKDASYPIMTLMEFTHRDIH